MIRMRLIEIDGRRYLWRDLLQLRRRRRSHAQAQQPALFELKDDCALSSSTARVSRGRRYGRSSGGRGLLGNRAPTEVPRAFAFFQLPQSAVDGQHWCNHF
jgi:hypothetical protein